MARVWHSVNVLHASLGKDTQTGQRSLIWRSRGWMLNPEEYREISLKLKRVFWWENLELKNALLKWYSVSRRKLFHKAGFHELIREVLVTPPFSEVVSSICFSCMRHLLKVIPLLLIDQSCTLVILRAGLLRTVQDWTPSAVWYLSSKTILSLKEMWV